MYPRKKFDSDPVWKYEELPPADLIKSLRLEAAAIDQDEFWRAEWFWSRRPKVLSESVSFFFFYLTVAVCLFYLLPGTIPFLLLWIVAGVSGAFVDGIHLKRWRNEYESSIKRVVIHLSERK
jgi:steroid 5-alpha reductase family enzyme